MYTVYYIYLPLVILLVIFISLCEYELLYSIFSCHPEGLLFTMSSKAGMVMTIFTCFYLSVMSSFFHF